jgi:hypothetical protein
MGRLMSFEVDITEIIKGVLKEAGVMPYAEDENLISHETLTGVALKNKAVDPAHKPGDVKEAGLFKPATPEQIASRPQDPEFDEASLQKALPQEYEDLERFGIHVTMHPEDAGIVGFIVGEDGDIMAYEEVEKYLQHAVYSIKRISRIAQMGRKKYDEYERRGGRYI